MRFSIAPIAPLLAEGGSNAALITFLVYIAAVFGIAWLSNKLLQTKSFLSEYFLGSRSLGVWAFALTFAATSASGGSFTGFPSKVYTHGWILGLWIGSYIVVPICAMGLLGKRINQVARISGSITVPDVLRDRFRSPHFGLLAVSLIVFFMSFNLVAQFKSGSEILKTLLQDVAIFNDTVSWVASMQSSMGFLTDVDPAYLLCLLTFAVAVIVYTTYGGFHAVVWTDVMQGIVMVIGVMIMLPLALWQVGGLTNATKQLSNMTPPRVGLMRIKLDEPLENDFAVTSPWFTLPSNSDEMPRLFRVSETLAILKDTQVVDHVKYVEITTPDEIRAQLNKLNPGGLHKSIDRKVVWLDKAPELAHAKVDLTLNLEYRFGAGKRGTYVTGPGPKPPSLPKKPGTIEVTIEPADAVLRFSDAEGKVELVRSEEQSTRYVALEEGSHHVHVSRDGYKVFTTEIVVEAGKTKTLELKLEEFEGEASNSLAADTSSNSSSDGFLPLSLAISFFFMWAISGAGQPSSMVRLMAFKNSMTLRRSIFTVAIYYSLIYFPLVIIFCCARVILPGMDLESDRIMPQMAVTLTTQIGQGWLAGLLVAAPFAAVMSTVDSFLLMISSALVRDIYQRNINPRVQEKTIKRLSYLFTMLVGAGAMFGAVNPPQFLQDIIVYTGSGLAACFLGPMVFALYWPRANSTGCITGMLAGFLAHLSMYVGGMFANGSFYAPYRLFNFNPIIVGLVVSFAAAYFATLASAPPPDDLVKKYFYRNPKQTK